MSTATRPSTPPRGTPRTAIVSAIVLALVAAHLAVPAGAGATTPDQLAQADQPASGTTAVPSVIGSLGDSISEGTGANGGGQWGWPGSSRPRNSWTTGDWPGLDSHAQRLEALGADVVRAARSANGARMATDVVTQAQSLPADVEYVTVQLGGNDLCRPDVDSMTPTAVYAAEFDAAMSWISTHRPEAIVNVSSVPDIYRLWEIRRTNWIAVLFWASGIIPCQSLLANPLSTSPAAMARRDAVRQRGLEYNAALADVCAAYTRCHYDDGAVWTFTNNPANFVNADISTQDHFHPSYAGQQKLAAVSWEAGWVVAGATAAEASASTAAATDGPTAVAAPARAGTPHHAAARRHDTLPPASEWTLGPAASTAAADRAAAARAQAADDVRASRRSGLEAHRAVARSGVPALRSFPDHLLDDLPETACAIASADPDGFREAAAALIDSGLVDREVAAYLLGSAVEAACPAFSPAVAQAAAD